MQALRAEGSQDIEKYIETFDKELAAKAQQIGNAEKEISRLRAELRIHQARLPTGTASLLRMGGEQEFYQNEVFGIVRDAIEDASTRVSDDSRRRHVLASVLHANPVREDLATPMREEPKQLLRGSRGVDAKVRHGLEEMGFSIAEDGKHYKLVYQGDDRYTFTLPKSGSDRRGGLNAARDIGRLLFWTPQIDLEARLHTRLRRHALAVVVDLDDDGPHPLLVVVPAVRASDEPEEPGVSKRADHFFFSFPLFRFVALNGLLDQTRGPFRIRVASLIFHGPEFG